MTTLISVHTSDGCVGRCDAKCYEATTPDCDCVCGGRNHGAGKQQAIDNTRDMAETMLQEYAAERNLREWTSQVSEDVYQLNLFMKDPFACEEHTHG
jgi:hypothetical protein